MKFYNWHKKERRLKQSQKEMNNGYATWPLVDF